MLFVYRMWYVGMWLEQRTKYKIRIGCWSGENGKWPSIANEVRAKYCQQQEPSLYSSHEHHGCTTSEKHRVSQYSKTLLSSIHSLAGWTLQGFTKPFPRPEKRLVCSSEKAGPNCAAVVANIVLRDSTIEPYLRSTLHSAVDKVTGRSAYRADASALLR